MRFPTRSFPPLRLLRRLLPEMEEGGGYHAERVARRNEAAERTNNSLLRIYEECSNVVVAPPTPDHPLLSARPERVVAEWDWGKAD